MSVSQGLPNYLSSVSNIGTRVQGPALAGQIADTPSLFPYAGGFICIQSTASIANQVVSTVAAVLNSRASFAYIPVTTGPLFASTEAPPYAGVGTPIVWDDTNKTLSVWSSGSGVWMRTTTPLAST